MTRVISGFVGACTQRTAALTLISLLMLPLACSRSDDKSDEADGGARGTTLAGDAGLAIAEPEKPMGEARIDRLDILFVIDNSEEMTQEQQKLRDEAPRLIQILASGDLNPNDGITTGRDFRPVGNLHLAVVSSDMGLPGVPPDQNPDPADKCGGLGDDGLFQHVQLDPSLRCQTSYPPFLSYVPPEGDDPNPLEARSSAVANDFSCIATLGTTGCGFEMPLEASLKALWPSNPYNLSDRQRELGVTFLEDSPGHGDTLHGGFLRGTAYHPTEFDTPSLLAIILVTEEDDCSAGAQGDLEFLHRHYQPPGPDQDSPAINLRCYYDTVNGTQNKYPVTRYIEGFKALREGYEQRVVFAAIAGTPPEIIESDYDDDDDGLDAAERDKFYDAILEHPDMEERIRADGWDLEPVCSYPENYGDTVAWPARRIVQVARGFGENGVVQSICQENFTSAVDAIVETISRHFPIE